MSLIAATASFTPSGDTRRLLDLYVLVKVFAGVQRAQAAVVAEAQSLAPVITGDLRGSIVATEPVDDGRMITGSVAATSEHAGFVEFGTGLTGSGSYPFPLPQEGVPITGSWIYDYKNQGWRGMLAQPYLRPALDSARSAILGGFSA